MIKDECRYVKEFADWHLSLGFNKIYFFEDYDSKSHKNLFENNENVEVKTLKEYGIKNFKGTFRQYFLYKKFAEESKGYYDWVAFIDVDEFIVFDKDYTLEKFLKEYENYPAVYLRWMMYGANGHIKRPNGKVMDVYTKPTMEEDCYVYGKGKWSKKSFVNINKYRGFDNIHIATGGVHTDYTSDYDMLGSFDKAHINHYHSKSWEDYCERIFKRGNMSNQFVSLDLFFVLNKDLERYKNDLINSVRMFHTQRTMWISKDAGIISGGNISIINKLKHKNNIIKP